jgi:hypothetical protein
MLCKNLLVSNIELSKKVFLCERMANKFLCGAHNLSKNLCSQPCEKIRKFNGEIFHGKRKIVDVLFNARRRKGGKDDIEER